MKPATVERVSHSHRACSAKKETITKKITFYSYQTNCDLLITHILNQNYAWLFENSHVHIVPNNIGLIIWTNICLAYSNIIKILLPFTQRKNQSRKNLALYTLIVVYFSAESFCANLKLLLHTIKDKCVSMYSLHWTCKILIFNLNPSVWDFSFIFYYYYYLFWDQHCIFLF